MSSNSKHTPGPWFCDSADVEGAERAAVRACDGALVAVAWAGERDDVGVIGEAEQDANAALIAAAPDLLAALRDLANQATYYAEKFALNIPSIGAARAAIARAEGAPK